MKVYQVGGCVRDRLLGREPKDIDYVVTGGSEQEMLKLGYQKVGADFPVFLKDGCEWALARKERKVGVGYNGFEVVFDPSVTLEEDLSRRDLTINAMAVDQETGEIIDPFGGRTDLHNQMLRHVSDAFAEDPVRVLRTARFAARYNFHVHPKTMKLMREVAGELNHVPQERIWAEFEKGLMEASPARMFHVLFDCGAMKQAALIPYTGIDIDMLGACKPTTPLRVRFAAIASTFEQRHYEACRIPGDCSRVAAAFNQVVDWLIDYHTLPAKTKVALFVRLRAFNTSDLMDDVLAVWDLAASKGIDTDRTVRAMTEDLAKLKTVDVVAIANTHKDVGAAILAARLKALGHP